MNSCQFTLSAFCLKVIVSRLLGSSQNPSEQLRDEASRSPTPIEMVASDPLSPVSEEETDQFSSPLTPDDPVKTFGCLLQHLSSAILKV